MNTHPPVAARILIIDDRQENVQTLSRMFEAQGYRVRQAISAELAFTTIRNTPPDLIMLNSLLPDMSGCEVCTRLKAEERTRDIPVVFISVLESVEERVSAFEAGGADYVTRPFAEPEVLARINTHLTLRRTQLELARANAQLKTEIAERTRTEEEFGIYHNIVSSAPDGIAFLDEHYRYRMVNAAHERVSGVKREQFIGQTVAEYLGEKIFQQHVKPYFDRCLQGETLTYQDWFTSPTLGKRFVTVTYFPYKDRHNHIIGVVSNTRDITDYKRGEEKIRFQAHMLDSVEQAVIATTPDGVVTYLNACAETLYGWSAEDAVGRNVVDIAVLQMSAKQAQDILVALSKGKSWQGESLVRRKDGSLFPANIVASPVCNEMGAVVGVVGISSDITARKQAEEALQLNETRRQLLLELHKRMDAPQPEFLDFVQEAAVQTAQSQYAVIGLLDDTETVLTIHAGATNAMTQCAIDRCPRHFPIAEAGIWGDCVRQRRPVIINEYAASHPSCNGISDGHVPMTRFLGIPVFDGSRIVAVAGVANKAAPYTESDSHALLTLLDRMWDIVRHKQVAERLARREHDLRLILDNIPAFVSYLDHRRHYRFVNQRYADSFRMSCEAMVGKPYREIVGETYYRKTLHKIDAVIAGHPVQHETTITFPEGGLHWLVVSYLPDRDAEGQVQGVFVLALDITERKRAEEQLKKSLTEKEVLLQELYHRTKNNMNVIGAMLSMQANELNDQRVSLILEEIRQRIMAMAMVHEQLYQSQDLSHVELQTYTEQLAVSILESYQVAAGHIALKVDVEPIVVLLETAIPYGQIVTELMTNALKYAFPEGRDGEIGIALRRLPGAQELELRFRDNGVGLPENLDIRNTKSFGITLITLLVDMQFQGTLDYQVDNGTEFRIRFQELDYTARV